MISSGELSRTAICAGDALPTESVAHLAREVEQCLVDLVSVGPQHAVRLSVDLDVVGGGEGLVEGTCRGESGRGTQGCHAGLGWSARALDRMADDDGLGALDTQTAEVLGKEAV